MALAGLLTGCGSSGDGTGLATSPLTNPDLVLFGSGRAADASWPFYAVNPDGSGTVPVPGLRSLNAKFSRGITLDQSGTFAALALGSATAAEVERRLVRLSDGATIFSATSADRQRPTVFSPTLRNGLLAVAGSPAPGDAYGIYTVSPDGTQKTRLYTLPVPAVAPAFAAGIREILSSPDGMTLYFVTQSLTVDTPPIDVLYRLAIGESAPTVIANIGQPIGSVHISSDGTKLAFVSVAPSFDLTSVAITPYTLNTDGSGLTKGAAIAMNEYVAPENATIASRADGFHLLYLASISGVKQVFDVRPDGTGRKQVTFNAADSATPGSR